MKKIKRLRVMLFATLLLTIVPVSAEETEPLTEEKGFFDIDKALFVSDEDGKFDISDFLSTQYGFMPMPIIVTEPAVGYGAGLNIMFLHDSLASSAERKSPPSISGVIGLGTENGTRFAAGYHFGFWNEDSIRTTTAAGALNVNMNFYLRAIAVDMNLQKNMAFGVDLTLPPMKTMILHFTLPLEVPGVPFKML